MRVSSSLKYAGHMARCRLRGQPALVMTSILPTFRCNLRCTYCNLPGLKTPELSPDLWKGVIDRLSDLGCRRVSFLGGEPLLRADLPELVDRVRRRGIPVKINAVLSSRTSSGLDDLLEFIEKHDLHVTLNVMRSRRPELWGKAASIKDDDGNIRKLLVRIAGLAT